MLAEGSVWRKEITEAGAGGWIYRQGQSEFKAVGEVELALDSGTGAKSMKRQLRPRR